jgi:hypothetical protein
MEKIITVNSSTSVSPPLPNFQTTMENFAINPQPFVPPAMFIEDGGPHHRARKMVYISGGPAKSHEDYVIAISQGEFSITQHHQLFH